MWGRNSCMAFLLGMINILHNTGGEHQVETFPQKWSLLKGSKKGEGGGYLSASILLS